MQSIEDSAREEPMRIPTRSKFPCASMWFACAVLLAVRGLGNCDSLASDSALAHLLHRPTDAALGKPVATGKFSKVLVIRLKNGEDLLKGLERAVSQEAVR